MGGRVRGEQAYHDQARPLVVQSSVGALRLERRAYYRCPACKASGYPLDERLGPAQAERMSRYLQETPARGCPAWQMALLPGRLGQQILARFGWPAVAASEVRAKGEALGAELGAAEQRRLAVVMALREALASGAVGVAFQPKVSSRSSTVTGVEALARWTHPALGSISPDEFVPLAEAAGLMGQLTSTVLRQALTACQGWQRRGGAVGVSVNVSANTLQDGGLVTEVAAVLRSTGVAARLLTLELTEGVVVADPQLAAERMHELRALGVKLSVDDFGTGYSSLTYLKGLPIDEVKIDKGFVAGLVGDPGDQAVVRAVVDIAHTLGMAVVAEGVEQEDQHCLLRSLGVDEEQGYLHARPMPALEMATWLRRREDVKRLS